MESRKLIQNSTGLHWISCFAIISILFHKFSPENTKGNLDERKNEIYQGNLPSSYGLDDLPCSIENQGSEIPFLKFLTQNSVLFSINTSELSLMLGESVAEDCFSTNSLHTRRKKRQDSPAPDGGSPTPAGGSPAPAGDSPTPAGGSPAPAGDSPTPAGGSPTPAGGSPTTTGSNETSTTTAEPEGEGWPTWAWIVIAVAAILVLIAIIIGIIVCINMNKSPEEVPPSAAESAASLSGSESEGSETEGGRRLHRGRRQIAACSYCPQTLQRNENDGIPCGRSCCDTELYERRNLSNTS